MSPCSELRISELASAACAARADRRADPHRRWCRLEARNPAERGISRKAGPLYTWRALMTMRAVKTDYRVRRRGLEDGGFHQG